MTPLWVRLWHWASAILFMILIFTGIVLTYSSSSFALMDYELADTLHQVAGVAFSLLFVVFFIVGQVAGYWRKYHSRSRGLWSRIRQRAVDVVRGGPERDPASRMALSSGFLILIQQLLYVFSVAILSPALVVTGLLFLYPEYAPSEVAGLAGLWPIALAHYWVGLIGTLFLLFHIYIATIGGLRRMIRGR